VTPQIFKTRITDLFGIRHPLICGGLMWLADARYVGAVVNAGGMGFITPRSFPSFEAFRDQLKKCRDITAGKPFGVNLYVAARPENNVNLARYVDILIEEGVRFVETAGYSPKDHLPKLKAAGIKVIHKCTTLRHAESAEKSGVDAVTILGQEAGGHPGMQMIGAIVQGALVPRRLSIPVVLGGGMATGRQLVAALALGAEGMLMGSRMTVADEIWAHPAYKERVVAADPAATRVIMTVFGDNSRVLDNRTARAVSALERQGVKDFEPYRPLVRGAFAREAYETGDVERGALSLGQSCGLADAILPVEAIFDEIMADAAAARARLGSLAAS